MSAGEEQLPDAADNAETAVTASGPPPSIASSKTKKMRKRKRTPPKRGTTQQQSTMRRPPWAYIHLQHVAATAAPTSSTTTPAGVADAVTVHLHLRAALSRFRGLHGAAVPVDILRLDGADAWVRVPAQDGGTLVAAVAGWVSSQGEAWRVKGTSSWDARAMARHEGGQDLFGD